MFVAINYLFSQKNPPRRVNYGWAGQKKLVTHAETYVTKK